MKLRFEVNQAEAFRRGIDAPKSIVTIEKNPADLTAKQRNLIADRLDGIDVLELWVVNGQKIKSYPRSDGSVSELNPVRIVANLPTFESLLEAVERNEREVETLSAKKVKNIHNGEKILHCRITGLTYANSAEDTQTHKEILTKAASGALPLGVREAMKSVGWSMLSTSNALPKIESETAKLLICYAWWARAKSNHDLSDEHFEPFMHDHLFLIESKFDGKEDLGQERVRKWNRYAG